MGNQLAVPRRNVWEQWDWVWHISAYTFFGLNLAIVLGVTPAISQLPLYLGLSALLALWYLPFIATPCARWQDAPRRGLIYFFLGWAILGGLLAINVGSLILVAMFYPVLFTRFPIRWAIPLAVSLTFGLYLLYVLLYAAGDWYVSLIIVLGFLIVASLMGVFVAALIKQSLERQRLLDEFTQTRAGLLKAEREAGVAAERQRLAREIHDTLAQHFTSIIMHLSAARLGDPAALQTRLEQAEQTAREGLGEARRLIWDKQPEQLEQASLIESIEGLAARWSVENAVKVSMATTGTLQLLDSSIDIALLRISQEALHNIKKHARARNVNITLSYMPDLLALDIADDGQGFDTKRNGRGFGLTSMRQRAEELGGELTIESEPGKGAKIAVSIPLPDVT